MPENRGCGCGGFGFGGDCCWIILLIIILSLLLTAYIMHNKKDEISKNEISKDEIQKINGRIDFPCIDGFLSRLRRFIKRHSKQFII